MIPAIRLAAADVAARWSLVLGAALLVAAPLAGYLLLDGYTRALESAFTGISSPELIVQETNSVGEFVGSRIPATVEDTLLAAGVPWAVPEIHTVTGTAADNALLLRGVDPERYRSVSRFDIVSGEALAPDDPIRSAMVGAEIAVERGIVAGGEVMVRGRPFTVVGTFAVGTYADHEVWISIAAAQETLGWGSDVSVFVIPGNGPLVEGDLLPGPLSVVRRGDFAVINEEWQPVIDLLNTAALALAVAGVLVIASVLWRMARLRARELAVLRTIGLGGIVPATYLALEALAVAVPGIGTGLLTALGIGAFVEIEAFGIVARPVFAAAGIGAALALAGSVVAAAAVAAGLLIRSSRPVILLRRW